MNICRIALFLIQLLYAVPYRAVEKTERTAKGKRAQNNASIAKLNRTQVPNVDDLVESPPPENYIFRVVRLLASGGYGHVFLATVTTPDSVDPYALKYITSRNEEQHEEEIGKAIAEGVLQQDLFRLGVPVPRVYKVWRADNLDVVIAMDLAEQTVYDYMGEHKGSLQMARNEALMLCRQMILAVYACHKAGVYHLDIKLSNFLVMKDKSIKITDFGLASREEYDSGNLGTPGYLAPEAFVWPHPPLSSAALDAFALGVCLLEVLSGRFQPGVDYELKEEDQQRPDLPKNGILASDEERWVLIRQLTESNPHERLTDLTQLLNSESFSWRKSFFFEETYAEAAPVAN